MSRSFRRSSLVLLLPALGLLFAACSDDDPAAAPSQPSAGKAGAAGSAGGAAGQAGGAGKAGAGGANAGTGGNAGSAGASAGSAGSSAGSAGTTAGAAGATGGSGGATAGAGGATAGAAGATAGAAGATAGSGGSSSGAAGTSAGNGGTSAGNGGTSAGNAGSGGSDAGAAGTSAGSGGAAGTAAGGSAGTSSGGNAGAAGSGGAAVPACGNAPLQRLNLVATIATDEPKTAVTVVGNTCPTATVQIPYKGQAAYDVERNKPYFLIGTQAGNLTSFTIESNIKIAALPVVPGGFIMVPPTYPTLINPAWNPLTMAIFRVQISSTAKSATAPCNDKGGVTFAVPNHPEAVVKYGGNGASTGSGGDANAWITIVTTGTVVAPEYVTVTAVKAGCKVGQEQTSTFFNTGRIPVAINVSTAELGLEISN